MTGHTDGIPGMTPGRTAPGTEPVIWQEPPRYMTGPKKTDDIDKESPLEMDPIYAHLRTMYEEKQQPEHVDAPPGSEDRQDPVQAKRTPAMDGPPIDHKAAIDPDWTAACGAGWIPEDGSGPVPPARNTYRTQALARKAGAVPIPERLALITAKEYQNALTPVKNGSAYIQPLLEEVVKHLTYSGDKFFYDGVEMTDTQLETKFNNSKEAANNVDAFLLLALYSVILGEIQRVTSAMDTDTILKLIDDQRFLMFPVVIYMPEFMARLGWARTISAQDIQTLSDKILSYNGVTGRMKCRRGFHNIPFMLSTGLDPDTNNLTITSPYMNKLVIQIFDASIERITEGQEKKPRLKRNGKPFTQPTYSRMIKTSICKEKNERAKAIVKMVVELIETSGDRHPKLKARTIVNRVKDLKAAYDAAESTSDKNKKLRRAFAKAWELLETKTWLRTYYPGITLPDVNDKDCIPTTTTIDTMVFIFHNNGKTKIVKEDN